MLRRKWLISAGTLLVVMLILSGCRNDNRIDNMNSDMDSEKIGEAMSQSTQNEGKVAPMFELTDIDGN